MSEILLIAGEPLVREILQQALSKEGHEVFVIEKSEEGLEVTRKHRPQLVILNSTMLKMKGGGEFRYLHPTVENPHSIIVLTRYSGVEEVMWVEEMTKGVVDLVSRIEEMATIYGVPLLISESALINIVRDELHYIRFIDRVRVQGKSRTTSVYEVFATEPEETRESKARDLILFEDAVSYYHFRQISEARTLFLRYLESHPEDQVAHIYLERCENFLQHGQYSGIEEVLQKVEWSDDLATEVEVIDQQHQELFNRINQLLDAVRQDLGKRIIVEVIRFLEAYTVTHFGEEEKLMQQYSYPHYSQHKATHTQFIEELDLLKEKNYEQRVESLHLVLRIRDNLVDWFTNHIHKEDKKLAFFLRAR